MCIKRNKKPILITGAPRSGTTWTGRIISLSTNVRYIHEPFNLDVGYKNTPIQYWLEFIDEDFSDIKQKEVLSFISSFYGIYNFQTYQYYSNIKSIRGIYHFLNEFRHRLYQRPLIKDPIAIMSTEWIYKKLNCNVVITIRHPAAFVASLLIKGWEFDFNNYLVQKNLMDKCLYDYTDDIVEFSKNRKSIIDQGILLWNTIYSIVYKYKKKYNDDWMFVKHEDLSKLPVEKFKDIFKYLNINFDSQVEKRIISSTTASKNTELERNSLENLCTWKSRLSPDEINNVKEKSFHVWNKFYSEDDWK